LPSLIAGRVDLWLGREEKAGRTYLFGARLPALLGDLTDALIA
jgi:hypothetical protein